MADVVREEVGASRVSAALARLAAAGEVLEAWGPDRRLEALGALLDQLAAPASTLREELGESLSRATGLHPTTVDAGLARALGAWSGRELRRLVAEELGGGPERIARGFSTTAVLLGGSLPMPGLLSILLPLAIGSAVLARPGRHDPVTGPFLAEALRALDPQLGACVECVGFAHEDDEAMAAFLSAPCVVATGADDTMQRIASLAPASTRLVRHGHRLSVAVWALSPRAEATPRAALALAEDVSLWDQLGCLSPLAVYVASSDAQVAPAIEEAIAEALDAVAQRWPRGRVEAAAGAAAEHEADTAELRAAAGDGVRLRRGRGWTLVCEPDARMRSAPLHRFVRLHPVADPASLATALAPLSGQLAAVGITPDPGRDWQRAIVAAGPSRLCGTGRMQAPPLTWSHDGQGPLRPLLRLTDVEEPFDTSPGGGHGSPGAKAEVDES